MQSLLERSSTVVLGLCCLLTSAGRLQAECASTCADDVMEVELRIKQIDPELESALLTITDEDGPKSAAVGVPLKPVKIRKNQQYQVQVDAQFPYDGYCPLEIVRLCLPCGFETLLDGQWATGDRALSWKGPEGGVPPWILTLRIKPTEKSERGSTAPEADTNNPGAPSFASFAPATQGFSPTGSAVTTSPASITSAIPLGYVGTDGGSFVEAGNLSLTYVMGASSLTASAFELRSFFFDPAAPTSEAKKVRWISANPAANPRIAVSEEAAVRLTNVPTGVLAEVFPRVNFNAATGAFSGQPAGRYEFLRLEGGNRHTVKHWLGQATEPSNSADYKMEGWKMVSTVNGSKSETDELGALNAASDATIRESTRVVVKKEFAPASEGGACVSMVVEEYGYIPVRAVVRDGSGSPVSLGNLLRVDEVLLSTRKDLDGVFESVEGPAETTEYYGRTSALALENYHLTGKRKFRETARGDWSLYGYNLKGDVNVIFEPWLSTPPAPWVEIVSAATEIPGPVKKTVLESMYATGTTTTITKTWLVAAGTSRLITDRVDNSSSGGSWGSSLTYDGESVTHVREVSGTWTAGSGNVWTEFNQEAETPTHSMRIVTHGTIRSTGHRFTPAYIDVLPRRSHQEIEITEAGRVLLRETRILPDGAGSDVEEADFETATREIFQYQNGEMTTVIRDGRTISSTSYPTPFLTVTVDESGVESSTLVDALGRVIRTSTAAGGGVPEMVETTEYLGLETKRYRNGFLMGSQVRDLAGRTVQVRDATGALTSYSYSPDGRETTEVRPGGGEVITQVHRDGRADCTRGHGSVQRFYQYDVEPVGGYSEAGNTHYNLTTTERIGWNDGSQYTKYIYSWIDGSLLETRTRDAATGAFEVVNKPGHPDFMNNGTFAGTSATDGSSTASWASSVEFRADTLAGSMGMESLAGKVGGWSSAGATGGTRMVRSEVEYVKDEGKWWEKKIITRGIEEATATRQSYMMERLWVGDGLKTRWVSGDGETSTTFTTFNRAAKEMTVARTSNASSVPTYAVTVNGYPQWEQDRNSANPSQRTVYGYDSFGHLASMQDPRGGVKRTMFNPIGQLKSSTDAAGNLTRYAYWGGTSHGAGKLQTVTHPDGTTTTYSYNSRGELATRGGTAGYPVSFTYTLRGDRETATVTNAKGTSVTRWIYLNDTGLVKYKVFDWKSGDNPETKAGTTKFEYDPFGRLKSIRVIGGNITRYEYNTFGELTGIDRGGNGFTEVAIGRNGAGAVDVVTENFEDSAGNSIGVGTTSHQYAAGKLDVVQYSANHPLLPGFKLDYKHTPPNFGRSGGYQAYKDTDSILDVSYGYDASARLKSVASPQHGFFEYGYVPGDDDVNGYTGHSGSATGPVLIQQVKDVDLGGRTSSLTYRNGLNQTVSYHGYKYDGMGRRTRVTREDGGAWWYERNPRGEVTKEVRQTPGGLAIDGLERQYKYDEIGNREWMKSGGGANGALSSTNYEVDGANRYDEIETPGKAWVLGNVPAGQQVKVNDVLAGTQELYFSKELSAANTNGPVKLPVTVKNGAGTLVSQGDLYIPKFAVSPLHDAAGNLANDGIWEYTWDSQNRLRRVETADAALGANFPDKVVEYFYDWQGRRLGKKVTANGTTTHTRYLYEDWNVVASWEFVGSGSGSVQTYLWGLDLQGQGNGSVDALQGAGGVAGLLAVSGSSGNFYASHDAGGNITSWLDSAGGVASRKEYDAFGNTVLAQGVSPCNFGFSTKLLDAETGHYDFGYRYYDPTTGRWLSRDPIGEEGGLNLYGFVANDPVTFTDKRGMKINLVEGEEQFKSYIAGNKLKTEIRDKMHSSLTEFKFANSDDICMHVLARELTITNMKRSKGGYGASQIPPEPGAGASNDDWLAFYDNFYKGECTFGCLKAIEFAQKAGMREAAKRFKKEKSPIEITQRSVKIDDETEWIPGDRSHLHNNSKNYENELKAEWTATRKKKGKKAADELAALYFGYSGENVLYAGADDAGKKIWLGWIKKLVSDDWAGWKAFVGDPTQFKDMPGYENKTVIVSDVHFYPALGIQK